MARRYNSHGNQNAAAGITILGLTSASTIRPVITEFVLGSGATPADQANNMHLQRFTAAGTSTAFTPIALDPADPASLAAAGYNHTAEPTYTANAVLYSFSVNQQATFRWWVPDEKGLKAPATAANGIGMQFVVATGTALHEASFHHLE